MNEERIALRRRRDLSELIESAGALYFRNFVPLLTIAAIVIPLGIAGAIFQASIEDDAVALSIVGLINLVQSVVNILAAAAIIAAIVELDAGRPADFSRAYDVAFGRFWTLLGAYLRVLFHVILLTITIIGIYWAIQRAVRWLFIQQAIVMDGANWKDALSVSADAVIGSWWRTLGISIVFGIITFVPAAVVSAFFVLAPIVVSGTVNAVVNAAILPFGVIAGTMLYMDLKVRKAAERGETELEQPDTY